VTWYDTHIPSKTKTKELKSAEEHAFAYLSVIRIIELGNTNTVHQPNPGGGLDEYINKEEIMRFIQIAITCFCLMITASFVMAGEKKQAGKMDPQETMEMYKKFATPGEPHKQLASLAGSWTTKTKMWMEPNKPPTETTGFCEQKVILEGRFLQQECTGEMMGGSFTGIGVTGYDNQTKKYVSTWMDSMGTGIFVMEGTGSADGKTFTQKGSHADPVQGQMKHRAVTRIVNDNTEVFEMYGAGKDGKEMKMMEIIYTRK